MVSWVSIGQGEQDEHEKSGYSCDFVLDILFRKLLIERQVMFKLMPDVINPASEVPVMSWVRCLSPST